MARSGINIRVPRLEEEQLQAGWGVGAVVDVETTGLSHQYHEIVELALILFAYDRASGEVMGITDDYVSLRQPGRPIPREVIAIHGITDAMVRGKRLDEVRVEAMLARAEFIIAHNASFDSKFVTKLFPTCTDKPWLCSCHGIDWLGKGLPNRKLDTLIRAHGICDEEVHRAGEDALATLTLLALKGQDGVTHFAELAARHGFLAAEKPRSRRKTSQDTAAGKAATAYVREVAAAKPGGKVATTAAKKEATAMGEPAGTERRKVSLLADLVDVFRRHFAHPATSASARSRRAVKPLAETAGPVAASIISARLTALGGSAEIPLLRGARTFTAHLVDGGVEVSNLASQPFLPWAVFEETVALLIANGGRAVKGNAMDAKLCEPGLPEDSVEGHIASVIYGKQPGESVFRRITPICAILVWAGLCASQDGSLELTGGE